MILRLFLILTAFLLLIGSPLEAHQIGVDRVVLQELADNQYRLSYNAPPGTPEALSHPILPAHCQWDETAESTATASAGLLFVSEGRPLAAGDVIQLPWRRNGVIFLAVWKDGTEAQQFFMSGPEGIIIDLAQLKAGAGGTATAAKRYTWLGIEHIWKGLDHLLFVAGLLLLVKGARRLALTITAFTLAHSVTLALSVLGQIRVAQELVDSIVALSIVFLAVENVKALRGQAGLSASKPWIVSFGFGLIHGLGFAGALNALGLPASDVPPALLFFNVGVEIGQLMFVALWLGVVWALRQLALEPPRRWMPAPAYGLGIVAMWWFLDRVVGMFA